MIGSYESVRLMEEAGIASDRLIPVAGGETVRLSDDVTVTVLPSQHSCVWSHAGMVQSGEVCLGDLGVTWQEQRERMANLGRHFASLGDATLAHLRDGAVGQSPPRRRRRAALPVRVAGGVAAVPGHVGPLERASSTASSPTWRSSRQPVAATSTASRSRARSPTSSPARSPPSDRAASCSATTTTGCPASRSPTDMGPLRAAIAAASPDTELLEPGYLAATDVFTGL